MIQFYKGPFSYDKNTISNWNSNVIGIYYLGQANQQGTINVDYVGKATSEQGVRGRLLQHIQANEWYGITHFNYCTCSTIKEAEDLEKSEIFKFKPKYNIQNKY